MLLRRPGSFTDEPLISPSPLLMSPKHTYRCTIDWAVAHAQPIANRCTSRKCDELPTLRSIIWAANSVACTMSPRRTCLEVDSQGSYPKGAKARRRENKAKIKIVWRVVKSATLRRRGPVCVIFAVTQNRGKLGESAIFHRSRRLIFWAIVADYVRLAHASKQLDSIVSCLAQTDHFKR